MKIVEQSHEIISHDPLLLVERAGRTCYKSEDKSGCTSGGANCREKGIEVTSLGQKDCTVASCPEHSSNRFVKMLIKRGHHAMLEHAGATVKFVTNRGVTHELVRHRLCAFGQESTRYVNYGGDDIQFILPVWCPESILGPWPKSRQDIMLDSKEARAVREFLAACRDAEGSYKSLLHDYGWQPQQAREVLPNSLKTEIVVTANYREWRHILSLRALGTTGKPHPQMQALMLPLLAEFKELVPAMFYDMEAPCSQ